MDVGDRHHRLVALGVDAVYLKDPSGLLTPERVKTVIPAIKAACGELPLHLHSHCLTGLAPYTACRAVELGVDVVHTATSTLANGASHPSTEWFTRNIRRSGFEVAVDLAPIEEVAERLHISERTVKFHVSNLLAKFGVRRRADLILLCYQRRNTAS